MEILHKFIDAVEQTDYEVKVSIPPKDVVDKSSTQLTL